MKESKFIKKNYKEWQDFEDLVKKKHVEPEKLSFLFLKLTDDLSYARTHYPNRLVRQYLNQLGQGVFYKIYKNRKVDIEKIKEFWTNELYSHIWHSRKELIFTLIFFLFSVAIGVVSSIYEPEFVRVILGDDYVNSTLSNIERGDPMAIYKKSNAVDMFLGITFNNVMVSVYTFLAGSLAIVGSLYFMFVNGIMLGSFQYFFIEKDLFLESFLTIWQHGTLEISSIVIAGASGVVMGKGILFPGTYSRGQSFKISAKRGLNLLIGVIPILIIAGFIEGFFTRYTNAPDIIRVISIMSSMSVIIYMFIYRPYTMNKQGLIKEIKFEENLDKTDKDIELLKVKSVFEVFNDSIIFIKNNFRSLFLPIVLLTITYSVFVGSYFYIKEGSWIVIYNGPLDHLLSVMNFEGANFHAYLIHFIILPFIVYRSLLVINTKLNKNSNNRFSYVRVIYSFLIILIILSLLTIQNAWSILATILVLQWPLYFLAVAFLENLSLGKSYNRVFNILNGNNIDLLAINVIVFIAYSVISLLIETPFFNFGSEIFSMSLVSSDELSMTITAVLLFVFGWITIFSGFIILFVSFSIMHFNNIERNEAISLNKEIDALFKD